MAEKILKGVRVAMLAADGFEQVELTIPRKHLTRRGAEVEVVSFRPGNIRGMNLIWRGKKVHVDRTLRRANAADYDALFIPGGFVNPDFLRQSRGALDFVRDFERAGKPIASLCHGPWVLISAGLVGGRRLASWPGIADDVINAGGEWINDPAVRDGNWITSRSPLDLPVFLPRVSRHFAALAPTRHGRVTRWPMRIAAGATFAAGTLAALAARHLKTGHREVIAAPEAKVIAAEVIAAPQAELIVVAESEAPRVPV